MELLERDAPLKSLANSMREAAAGDGRVTLVYGEAGIGKTALAESFLAAHRAEARILVGRCDALFTPQPLGPLHDIAQQTNSALLELLRSAADRLAIFGTLLHELRSSERPTMLVFEDVHWADAATLDLLKYLGRQIRGTPTLMLMTFRDDELDASHALWSLLGDLPANAVRRVPLGPLSEAAVAQLARRAGRPVGGSTRRPAAIRFTSPSSWRALLEASRPRSGCNARSHRQAVAASARRSRAVLGGAQPRRALPTGRSGGTHRGAGR